MLAHKRYGWLQVIEGTLLINEVELQAGDGMSFDSEEKIALVPTSPAKVLFFDLP